MITVGYVADGETDTDFIQFQVWVSRRGTECAQAGALSVSEGAAGGYLSEKLRPERERESSRQRDQRCQSPNVIKVSSLTLKKPSGWTVE